MAAVFSEGWERAGGSPLEASSPAPESCPGSSVLVLDSRPGRGHRETASALAAIAAAAQRSLWITNAYFAPARITLDLLGDAAQRGLDVRLLLPGKTDIPIVRHAGHGFYTELLRRQVRIFEYQPAVLHAKSLVADDAVAVVGSSNLDFRSFRFNAECNLVLLDPHLAQELARRFVEDLAQSREILLPNWRRRPLPHRIGDSLARLLSPVL